MKRIYIIVAGVIRSSAKEYAHHGQEPKIFLSGLSLLQSVPYMRRVFEKASSGNTVLLPFARAPQALVLEIFAFSYIL